MNVNYKYNVNVDLHSTLHAVSNALKQ